VKSKGIVFFHEHVKGVDLSLLILSDKVSERMRACADGRKCAGGFSCGGCT